MKNKIFLSIIYILVLITVIVLVNNKVNEQKKFYKDGSLQAFYNFFDMYEYFLMQFTENKISETDFINLINSKRDAFYDLNILNYNRERKFHTDKLSSRLNAMQYEAELNKHLDIPLNYYYYDFEYGNRYFISFIKKVDVSNERWFLNIITDQTTFYKTWNNYRITWFSIYIFIWTFIFTTVVLIYRYYKNQSNKLAKKQKNKLFLDNLIKNDNDTLSLLINSQLIVDYINPRLANILKLEEASVIGKHIATVINNFDNTKLMNKPDINANDDINITDKLGNRHHFLATYLPNFTDNNELYQALIILHDINPFKSEIHNLEYELKKHSVINTFSQLVLNIDNPKSIIEIILDKSKELIDYDYATMFLSKGDHLEIFYSNDPEIKEQEGILKVPFGKGVAGLVAKIKKTYSVTDARTNPFVMQLENTDVVDESIVSTPMLDNSGGLIGVINLARDGIRAFTEEDKKTLETLAMHAASVFSRTNMLQKLVESDSKYQTLIYGSALSILIILNNKIVFCNSKFCKHFDYTEKELLGKDIIDLIADKDKSMFISHLNNFIMEETSEIIEFECKPASNKKLIMEFALSSIVWLGVKSIMATANNVTDKVELNKQLLQAQKIDSIGSLTSGIVHDFKNVLTGILGAADLILVKTETASHIFNLAKIIKTSANRAVILSQRLLSFSRKDDTEQQIFELNEFLREIVEIISYTFDKNIEVKVDIADEQLFFQGEQTKIQQCIQNLCVNARDAMPGGGTLTVRTSLIKDINEAKKYYAEAENKYYSLIEISDTGSGIPDDIKESIFEAFFTTKEKGKGTGLGLSTTKIIINDYKGNITLKSKLNYGTTFYIILPWIQHEKISNITQVDNTKFQARNILLVDDEELILEIGQELLEELGNNVFVANNGFDALEVIKSHPDISLALIDRIMPKMDGITLLKKIKAMRPDITVIIASGLLQESMVQDFLENGATDCITKPYRLEELKKLLANLK
jgi:PAS domain S-box-containing protein